MRILAVLIRPDGPPAVLTAAELLVSRLGGSVTALHARAASGEIPGEVVRANVVAECGEAELVVLGRSPRQFYQDMHGALRGALLDAGAPVLLMADSVPAVIGEHIAVAWKPGIPAEHAIAAALPLLRKASQVTVLIADDTGADDALPDELLDELDRAGVPHAIDVFRPDAAMGIALSRQARLIGADLLVMGAMSHSRLMEHVFGRTTQDVIDSGFLPVLLRH
jgi:nucleotide-binding universal stress UspA family protein